MSRRRVPNHKPVWELHTSATLPPFLLLSIESTTNLVGHNIFTSIRDRHKNMNSQRTSMALKKSACNSAGPCIPFSGERHNLKRARNPSRKQNIKRYTGGFSAR